LWLSFVIQVEYHANELNDPDNFDSDDEYDQLKTNFKELGRHVEDKISSLASSYDSSAWKQDFRNNLIEATSYSVGHEQDHGKCDACGRSSNSSRIRIKLVDEDEVSKYDIGYDCMAKTYSFHTVYHFKTHLIDKIASRLESVSLEEFMEDADWIWREFNRFNHLMSHSQLHYENIRDENAVQIEEEECVQVQATVSTQSYHSSISIEKIKEYEKKKITGKEFQNVKNELLLHYYHQFNDNVFGGRLPNIRVITSAASETDPHLTWNPRLTTTAGRANLFTRGGRYTGGIELSSQVINGIVRLQSTLAHEMCHLATYINHHGSAGHGKLFFQYGNLITRKYGHITVSTCHSYKIPTKFVYKCMRCGDEFPRQRQVEYGTTCRCLGELMMFRYETK
jgi:predicted SprT family Zn-dependent metalloprotease